MKNNLAQTTLRWWGGLRTIGGNIACLEYNNYRLIFDFGFIIHPNSEVLDDKVRMRSRKFVHDYVSLGLAPAIDGIYEEGDIKSIPHLKSVQADDKNTAVLISHLHLDHTGLISFLSPRIPIYVTEDSMHLYQALEVIGESTPFAPRTDGIDGGVDTCFPYKPNIKTCAYDKTFHIGEFSITPIQVDHDIPGACGFHIETPDGKIYYMGDFRMHGNNPGRIETAIKSVKERGVDILIMEGTTLSDLEQMRTPLLPDAATSDNTTTESEVPNKMRDILLDITGMGIFNIYHRNVERLENILRLNKQTNRTIVLEPETAYIADTLIDATDFSIYLSSEMKEEISHGQAPEWKVDLLRRYATLDATEINQNPGKFFVQNSYENILELLDLEIRDGVYLHSNGPPLGDYDPAYEHLLRFLKYLGLERRYVGSGGHALPQQLKYVLEKINPRTFIPIHSFHPERLVPDHARLVLPEYHVTYVIKNGNIIRPQGE